MAIKAIIGLGNEGREYKKTYHSVGLFLVDQLKDILQEKGLVSIAIFLPDGFMNAVGAKVVKFLKQKNVQPDEALVIHDDSDLLVGAYKLSFGGSSAGHKGIQNIIEQLGQENFWRLRIGIRDPREKVREKAGDFVLKKWSKADEAEFKKTLDGAWGELKKKKLL